ncbi:hypothetical protein QR680_001697 [Steinernema hermaphroditum]|uniref:Phospholipid/glycerol acyltransferase domain-containing protein n=1 Tax=Steinernema hermaphroditum TaxID=289476 RepID=A0AA39LGH5_9BILA|nr:hypothetical protein QR680_001697 [Steinernema hermaphroditum]
MEKNASCPEYVDWLREIEKIGGEFSWITASKDFPRNISENPNPKQRSTAEINDAVLKSHRVQAAIIQVSDETQCSREEVEAQARDVLLTMAHSFSMAAVRPIGYAVVKVIKTLFDSVFVNMKELAEVRNTVKKDPVVFMPTHNSYVDFLLLSLLCFDQNITLPAIAAGADFMQTKLMGEALRRCGAFFIRRSFGQDALYWALFTEYVQTHLINADRPIEFFVEVLLEPYLRGQVFDIVIVPVSMSYDKILEEFLYAYELLGFPKPKESTSGLLKARRILSRKFGRIYMTFGKPVSVREYFGSALHRSAFVCQPDSQFVLSEREKRAIRVFGHKIIETHNDNRVVGVWPYACVLIQQMIENRRRNGNKDKAIVYQELLIRLKHFVDLCSRLGVKVQIAESVEEDLRYYSSLHHDVFSFVPSPYGTDECLVVKEQEVVNGTHIDKAFLQDAVSDVLVSNYANLAIPHLIDISLLSLVLLHSSRHEASITFRNLRSIFMREFVYVPGTEEFLFGKAQERMLAAKMITVKKADCGENVNIEEFAAASQLAEIVKPYVSVYLYAIKVLMAIPLPPFSLQEAIRRIQIGISSYIQDKKSVAALKPSNISLDMIKNILHSLLDAGALKRTKGGIELNCEELLVIAGILQSVCEENAEFSTRYYPKL